MLMNLRNAMMAGRRLPYDAELEYLESTRTQWIDTGVVPNNSTGFTVDAMAIGAVPNMRILGVYETISGEQRRFAAVVRSGGDGVNARQFYFGWGAAYNFTASESNFMTRRVMGLNFLNSRNMTFDGGVVSSNLPTLASFTTSAWLFGNRGTEELSAQRIYRCKMSSGNEIVRDFIPVRKGTTGYLYDRVSKRLFGNAGTGDFVLGPDVVPVEYIESTGTQWIDTGFKANTTTTSFDTDFMLTTTSSNMGLFGSRNRTGSSDATSCNALFISGASAIRLDWAEGGTGTSVPALANTKYSMAITRGSATINGTTYTFTGTVSADQNYNFLIGSFSEGNGSVYAAGLIGRIYAAKLYSNGNAIRNYKAIRVGNGSTWEGAMMDVLTRRIYRNAGTGAFTYGNDLRYPIPSE